MLRYLRKEHDLPPSTDYSPAIRVIRVKLKKNSGTLSGRTYNLGTYVGRNLP